MDKNTNSSASLIDEHIDPIKEKEEISEIRIKECRTCENNLRCEECAYPKENEMLKAEIERLQKENNHFADLGKMYSEIRAEAIKEFISSATDLCYKEFENNLEVAHTFASILTKSQKEMVGEDK